MVKQRPATCFAAIYALLNMSSIPPTVFRFLLAVVITIQWQRSGNICPVRQAAWLTGRHYTSNITSKNWSTWCAHWLVVEEVPSSRPSQIGLLLLGQIWDLVRNPTIFKGPWSYLVRFSVSEQLPQERLPKDNCSSGQLLREQLPDNSPNLKTP